MSEKKGRYQVKRKGKNEYTAAQHRAWKNNDKKRSEYPAISRIRIIDSSEAEMVEETFRLHGGTKAEAVIAGLRLLNQKLKRKTK